MHDYNDGMEKVKADEHGASYHGELRATSIGTAEKWRAVAVPHEEPALVAIGDRLVAWERI